MGFIAVILTVCAVSQPDMCHDEQLQFAWSGSPNQCVITAQPYIARWIDEHPNWTAVRWRCEYPGERKNADVPGGGPEPLDIREAAHTAS